MNTKMVVSILVLIGGLLFASSTQGQVAISEDGVTFPDDPEPVWGLRQYEVGDIGPAGGWVFYVMADGLHGLEAAPDDQSTGVAWGCSGTDISGAEGTAVGTGARNAHDILHGCSIAGIAAAVAAEYVSPSGYFDWYLPSQWELDSMYQNLFLVGLGGFASDGYWSSSEVVVDGAWAQLFDFGDQFVDNKDSAKRVRAVRTF